MIWLCDLSELLWLLRLRYFWSQTCFGQLKSKSLPEKKYLPQLNCELSGGWPKKCSKTSIFRIVPRKSAICGIRPPVFSNSLPMNRSRYFRSVDCFWKFDGKTPHEKLFTTPAQSWTLWRPVENGCLKMPWFAPILGPLRPVFGTCYGKVVGMFFCKTAFCKVIFY